MNLTQPVDIGPLRVTSIVNPGGSEKVLQFGITTFPAQLNSSQVKELQSLLSQWLFEQGSSPAPPTLRE